jgi:predicted ABC-type ATPase
MDKRILIHAGPNGTGKTTFPRELLVREGMERRIRGRYSSALPW